MKKNNLVVLLEISIMAALAFGLGYVKIYSMPNGGSVSLEMLPVVIMSFRRGVKEGVITGFILGFLQMNLGGYIVSFPQVLFDYLLAFSVIGLSSMFGKKLPIAFGGIAVACFLRFAAHTYVGVFAWETNWSGSVAYNAPYMIASTILVMLVFIPITKNKLIMEA